MSHRFRLSHVMAAAAGLMATVSASSAYAGDGGGWRNGSWYGDDAPPPPQAQVRGPYNGQVQPARPLRQEPPRDGDDYRSDPRSAMPGREAWLADCRDRIAARDNGVGGAVIGGVVGGVAGNRIAGRNNRTVGTLGGAAIGAVAGSAIDRAEDRGRAADECEAYLDDYYARYAAGAYGAPGPKPGYAQAYAQPGYSMGYNGYAYSGSACCGGPVMVPVQQPAPECTETVEYIYEDVPAPRRVYHPAPRRTKVVRDKRIKIIPDKRLRAN